MERRRLLPWKRNPIFTLSSTICAFIGDTHSVYGATPPREYFTILREICDKHGILMICDEVVTGFGRTGKMFACDGQFNFIPDILTLGKGLTTGYLPLSATLISDRVREAFGGTPEEHKEFSARYTYAGVPLACAAGVATIREIREQRLVERVARMGDMVQERLGRLEEESPYVGAARSVGLLGSIEIVKDKKTREVFEPYALKDRINGALLEEGLSTYVMAYPPILVLMPPYVISDEELLGAIDRLANMVMKLFAEITGGERGSAGMGMEGCSIGLFVGQHPKTGEAYGATCFVSNAGGPGMQGYDGWPGLFVPACMGVMLYEPIELHELLWPHMVSELTFPTDSSSPGQWRGGPSVLYDIGPLYGDFQVYGFGDGLVNPPGGVLEGWDGSVCWHRIIDRRTRKVVGTAGRRCSSWSSPGRPGRPSAIPAEALAIC